MNTFLKFSAVSILALGVAGLAIAHEDGSAAASLTEQDVIRILEKHLQDKPEIVMEALERHQNNQTMAAEESAKKAIEDKWATLASATAPSAGASAEEADVTVVEFFDYNCGYCKRAVPDIQSLIGSDKKVRFVFKEMPILGPSSKTAAQYAEAAHMQGKYFDYHVALMNHRGGYDEAALEKIGADIGLDVEKLKVDAGSDAVSQKIDESMKLADEIGIRGTPAFIVDKTLFRGYLGPEGLTEEIKKAREN